MKNEVIAYVRCAVVEQVSYNYAGVTNFMEVEHPICVAEKYNELLTSEEFKKKGKELKSNIIENVKKNYSAISMGTRSIWD